MNRILIVFLFFVYQIGFTQTFEVTTPTFLPAPDITSRMEWLDIDNDRDQDMISFYYNPYNIETSYIKLYQNRDNVYELIPNAFGSTTLAPAANAFGDYDHDGDIDILIQNQYIFRILVNGGNGSFSILELNLDIEIYNPIIKLHWLDVDADFDLDIILPDFDGRSIVYFNMAGDYNQYKKKLKDSCYILSWADLNNDGLMDFIGIKGSSSPLSIIPYLNEGSGSFIAQNYSLSDHPLDYSQILWFDADADGDIDLFLSESNLKCTLFKNEFKESGQVVLTRAVQLANLNFPIAKVGDFDNNGLADILINGETLGISNRKTILYTNTSTNQLFNFTEINLNIYTQWVYNLNLLDVERDHDLDFFITTSSSTTFEHLRQFYKNINVPASVNPTVPVPLPVIFGDSVVLKWNPSTATGSSRYQVQVNRNGQSFNPSNSLTNGDLLMPDLVPSRITNSVVINGLPEGNYQWRVQSISANNVASEFCSYQSFTIDPSPLQLNVTQEGITSARLNWINSNPSISRIHVYRMSTQTGYKKIATLNTNVNFYQDNTLVPGDVYEYYLRAEMLGKNFAVSNRVTITTNLFDEVPLNNSDNIVALHGISADLDNDEDQDLVLEGGLNYFYGSLFFLRNNNGISYETTSLGQPSDDQGSPELFMRDFDNDGDQDLCMVVKEFGGGRISILENTQGAFSVAFTGKFHNYIFQIDIHDYNHDGKLDIFYSHSPLASNNTATGGYQLLLQKSITEFIVSGDSFVPDLNKEVGNFTAADFNNDGYTDVLIMPKEVGSTCKLFKNLEGQGFQKVENALTPIFSAFAFDFNRDGFMDLLYGDANYVRIFLGDGKFSFTEIEKVEMSEIFFQYGYSRMSANDMDLNGLSDLLVCDTYHCTLLSAFEDGSYIQSKLVDIQNSEPYKLIVSDIDKDGDFDLIKLSADQHEGDNSILKNRIITNTFGVENQPPSKPVIQSVGQENSQITVVWNNPTDDKSPVQSISYNIELSDQQSGKVIMHPETNGQGNYRRISGSGNAGYLNRYRFNDLSAGVYAMRVQAIDATFKLSPFSEPVQFTILSGPKNLQIERINLLKVRLSWIDDYSTETQFILQRKQEGTAFETIAMLSPNTVEFVDQLPSYNLEFQYRIYAVVGGISTVSSNVVKWDTILFKPIVTNLPNGHESFDVADFNEDGKMEVLMRGGGIFNGAYVESAGAIFEKTNAGWIKMNVGSSEFNPSSVLTAIDLNGDHSLDLFHHLNVGGLDGHKTFTYLNNQNNSFIETGTLLSDQSYDIKTILDYDLDNDLDIYVWKFNKYYEPPKELLLKNIGDGEYVIDQRENLVCYNTCFSDRYILADFDRDGDEDLFNHNPASLKYNLFINENGNWVSSGVSISSWPGNEVQAVDIDADGWLDLYILGSSFDNPYEKSKIYRNKGKVGNEPLQFEKVRDDLPAGDRIDGDWADYDHDGDIDFVIASKFIYFYANDGKGNFVEYKVPELYTSIVSMRWIDYEQDGDLDLMIVGQSAIVLINQLNNEGTGIFNQVPSSPTLLASHQDEKGIMLSWQSSEDDHSPKPSLTYDVILYKDGTQISKATINMQGVRTKLRAGSSVAYTLLNNLTIGQYSWRVQAVDQSYAGSDLSMEASFIFKPMAPLINDTTILSCGKITSVKAIGENIEWFSDETLTTKIASGYVYNPVISQVVYVTQTQGGIRSVPNKVNITIIEKPEKPARISPNPIVYCDKDVGQPVTIYVNGENINWYADADKKNLLKAGGGFNTLIGNKTFYATQTIQNCEGDPLELKMEINSIKDEIFLKDNKIHATETNAFQYEWYYKNTKIPNSNSATIDFLGDGVYSVFIMKGNCVAEVGPFLITAIEKDWLQTDSFEIYPNPAKSDFTIKVNGLSTKTKIEIYDILGRIIFSTELITFSASRNISTSNWEKGMYFISINDGKNIMYTRLVLH